MGFLWICGCSCFRSHGRICGLDVGSKRHHGPGCDPLSFGSHVSARRFVSRDGCVLDVGIPFWHDRVRHRVVVQIDGAGARVFWFLFAFDKVFGR